MANKIIKSKTHSFLHQTAYNFLYTNNPNKDIYEVAQNYIEQGYTVYVDGTDYKFNYTKSIRDIKHIKILRTYNNIRLQLHRLNTSNPNIHEILFIHASTAYIVVDRIPYILDYLRDSKNIIFYFDSKGLLLYGSNILKQFILGKSKCLLSKSILT